MSRFLHTMKYLLTKKMLEFFSYFITFLVFCWMIGSAIDGEWVVKKFEEDEWWFYRDKEDKDAD